MTTETFSPEPENYRPKDIVKYRHLWPSGNRAIWMFHSLNLIKINRIHERALRLVYHNNLSFSELFDLDNSVTVHPKYLQVLVTEIYKVKNGISSEIVTDIFELQNPWYKLC